MMPVIYFACSFGGLPVLAVEVSTERGRDVVVQSPSIGGQHTVRARSRKHQSTRCELLFIDQPGLAPYTDRYEEFVALAETSEQSQISQVFSHPLDGASRVIAGDLQVTADNRAREIRVSCTFHEETAPTPVQPVGGGVNPAAGADSVAVAAAAASESIAAVGIPADLTPQQQAARGDTIQFATLAGAADQVAAWRDAGDALDRQQVFLQVAIIARDLDALVGELELLADLARWPAYRDVIRLRYEVVRAGEASTAAARSTFDLYLAAPRPLLAVCAEVYGAADARARAEEVARTNRLRTPGLVPAATTLKMPAVGR